MKKFEFQNEFYHEIVDEIALVSVTDARGEIVYVNDRFAEVSKYSKAELIGQDHRIINSSIHSKDFQKKMWDTIKKGEVWRDIYINRSKDGELYWVDSSIIALKNEEGGIRGFISIRYDVTDKMIAFHTLNQKREMLDYVVEQSFLAVWEWEFEDEIFKVDKSFYKLFQIPEQNIDDIKKFTSLIYIEDLEKVVDSIQVIQLGSILSISVEFRYHDGKSFHFMKLNMKYFKESEDHNKKIIGVISDITKFKEGQKEIVMAKEKAEQLAKARTQFVANMSHELRTPMNGIISMVDILNTTILNEEQIDIVGTVEECAKGLLGIVNDILDYSKIESGKMNIHKVDFDLNKFIKNTSDILRPLAEKKSLLLKVEVSPEIKGTINQDEGRLRQVLVNIIGNAIKFTETGSITLKVEEMNTVGGVSFYKFSISDTGIGIEESKLASLFDSYSQACSDTSHKFGGTGLGLSIAKFFIELMGGSISVESEIGIGTTFIFTLKTKKVDSTKGKKDKLPLNAYEVSKKLKILVAEDNAINRKVIRLMFNKLGREVEIVEDGLLLVEKVKEAEWDLVITDIEMPNMNGIEATKEIIKLRGDSIQVVALTANALEVDIKNCFSAGIKECLRKPLDYIDLLKMIERLFKGSVKIKEDS